jgi:hypothetical protein
VRGWTETRDFRERVDNCRVEQAEQLVGKIATCVERAIDRLVELSENIDNPSVAVAASKAIIDRWISLTDHFVQERKFQDLTARVKAIEASRKAMLQPWNGAKPQPWIGATSGPQPG